MPNRGVLSFRALPLYDSSLDSPSHVLTEPENLRSREQAWDCLSGSRSSSPPAEVVKEVTRLSTPAAVSDSF